MKTTYIEVPQRRRPRRYRHCHCRKNISPIADVFHAPLTRWAFTLLAVLAATNQLAWPAVITAAVAWCAWRHR